MFFSRRAALQTELETWLRAGKQPAFWWRDDDAAVQCPELSALIDTLSSVDVALATVPALLEPALARELCGRGNVAIFQHGWRHDNHNGADSVPSEFPPDRDRNVVADELRKGQEILSGSFPLSFYAVFVPPWHSSAPWILNDAARLGFTAVSLPPAPSPTFKHGYCGELNFEIDLSDWSKGGAFIGLDEFCRRVTRVLKARRLEGALDEPIGILSHHKVLTARDRGHIASFLDVVAGASKWPSIRELVAVAAAH
jgi:hypothetical protein